MNFFSYIKRLPIALAGTLVLSQGHAMVALEEEEMSGVSGAGLAFVLGDGNDPFRFQMAPTSYIEAVGEHPNPTGDAAGTTMNQSDLRWYGLTMSGATGSGATWHGAACSGGLNSMGCPMTMSGITNFANHDNPYVLRVFDYSRVGRNSGSSDWVTGVTSTVLELIGPSNTDTLLWSFWGETKATSAAGTQLGYTLQSQNIIRGKPSARVKPPSIFGVGTGNPMAGPLLRMFQNQEDESFGMSFDSRLSGDYRFSVNQSASGASWRDVSIPEFTVEEGLYFTNVNAFLPLGQLHYQSLVLDDSATNDGNFTIELTRLPKDPQAFGDAYQIASGTGYQRVGRSDRYYETHGYVEWGDDFPTCSGANCMSGSGVSSVRFSGVGDGSFAAPTTFDLPTRTISEANFPDLYLCGSSRSEECQSWTGTAVAVNGLAIDLRTDDSSTRETVVAQGGIVFAARAGSSWKVRNNQNFAATTAGVFPTNAVISNAINSERSVQLTRTIADQTNLGCGTLSLESCRRLNSNSTPDAALIAEVARQKVSQLYNPELDITAINLGSSRVEGFMVQHLKITTLSAGGN